MIPRSSLAALLSSIVSQLSLLLLLYLHPSSLSSPAATHNHRETLLSLLLHHFLSSSHAAAASLPLPLSRKRKRPTPNSIPEDAHSAISPRLGELGRVDPGLVRDSASFRSHFSMSPSTFEWLSDLLEPLLDCRDPAGSPLNLSPELRLGIGLYRLSTGSDYSEIARLFRVSEPVARFCCKQLCRVLCTNFRFWVGFPNPKELKSVSEGFESLTGLPNCCGVIGCVRFRMKRVGGGEDQLIASQIVVDSNSRLLSIAAGFRGDEGNNLKVLKSSTLYKDVESGRLLNSPPISVDSVAVPQYFVGDGGYPLLPWLMVPFSDPNPGLAQQDLDSALRVLRLPLLKTVASLTSWGVLSRPIEGKLRNAVAYIGSCAILHNALLIRDDFSALCGDIRVDDSRLDHDHGLGFSIDGSAVNESIRTQALLVRSALAKMTEQASTTRE